MARYDAPIAVRSRNLLSGAGLFAAVGASAPVWNLPPSPIAINQGASIDFRTMCSSAFVMLFSVDVSSVSLTGTGLSQASNGVFTAAVGAPTITTAGIRIRADDQHGGVTVSPAFSVNVLAAVGPLVITIGNIPAHRFDPGVAGQSFDFAPFVTETGGGMPPLFYTLLGSMPGISLQGTLAVYDPSVLSGNVNLQLDVSAAPGAATPDLFAINDSTVDGANAGQSHPFAKLYWNNTTITYPQTIAQSTYSVAGTGYGDCVGTDNVAFPGSAAFFSRVTQPVTGANASLSIPLTSLVNFWISGHTNWGITLIGSAGSISTFANRTDATIANRPTLTIIRSDGSSVVVPCAANRTLIAPNVGTSGANIDCTNGAATGSLLLYFDLTQVSGLALPVQSATLTLFGQARGVPNVISVYATDMSYVLRAQSPVQGLAQGGVKDAALVSTYNADLAIAAGASPPAKPAGGVLYAETWPDLTGMAARNYYTRSSSGAPNASNMSLITGADAENPGYVPLASGVNAVKVKMVGNPNPAIPGMLTAMNLIWPFNGVWGYAPTHLWLRFYMMFANDWPFYDKKPGSGSISRGKFPFAPSCHTPPGKGSALIGKKTRVAPNVAWGPSTVIPDGGNGGTPATGANMWSMRNYWYVPGNNGVTPLGVVDPAIYGPLAVNGYWPISSEDMYSADQWGPFGDDNFWTSERTLAGLMKVNTWHAVEIHVQMNSLWTAASACPDPVYLGDVRRMPYRSGVVSGSNPLVNDQLGHDTSITTLDRFILFGDKTGQRYIPGQSAVAPDTIVINSATQYGLPSMIGNKDGIYETRIDGVLAHRRTDMRWRHIPDAAIDCIWGDYGQTQLDSGDVGSVYFAQMIAVDGDIVTGPIGPMRMS